MVWQVAVGDRNWGKRRNVDMAPSIRRQLQRSASARKGPSLTKRKHHHWKLRIIHAHDDVGDDNGSDVTGRSFTGEVVYDDMPTL